MLRTGWTRQELNKADPEDVERIIWAIDAERLAEIAQTIEQGIANVYVPESGPERGPAILNKAKMQDAVDDIDAMLDLEDAVAE